MQKLNQHNSVVNSPAPQTRKLKMQAVEVDSCVALKMPNSPIMTGRTDNVQEEMQNE